MTKRRLLDEKVRESETFGRFTFRQRDMWHGLIVCADDQGRLPGSANFIRSRIWPYDDIPPADVEADLAALEAAGNIHRYRSNGSVYLQVVNWWKYQQMQWAGPSSYPAPEGWVDRLRYHAQGNHVVAQGWDQPGGFVVNVPSKQASRLPRRQGTRIKEVKGEDEVEVEGESTAGAGAPRKSAQESASPETPDAALVESTPSSGAPGPTARGRPRNELFDAIVEVCGVDLGIRGADKSVGVICSALTGASPPYTAAEVRRWGELQAWRRTRPTIWQLRDGVGSVRKPNGAGGTNGQSQFGRSSQGPGGPEIGRRPVTFKVPKAN